MYCLMSASSLNCLGLKKNIINWYLREAVEFKHLQVKNLADTRNLLLPYNQTTDFNEAGLPLTKTFNPITNPQQERIIFINRFLVVL